VSDTGASPLDRLFAGGRPGAHGGRLLVLGRPPQRVTLLMDGWERVACVASCEDDQRPGTVRADPHHLPFVEALFDKALLSAPLIEPRKMLRELWRVLTPAGLAVLVVKARRPWQGHERGWLKEPLALRLDEAMFEVIDWQIELLPERFHTVMVSKRDGVRPALVGAATAKTVLATGAAGG
jgi:SAM-dependent methyltransferase